MLTLDQLRQMTPEDRQEYFVNKLCHLFQLGRHEISLDGPGKHIYLQCCDYASYQHNGSAFNTFITIVFYDYPLRAQYCPLLSGNNRFIISRQYTEQDTYEECLRVIHCAIRHTRNAMRVDQLETELAFRKANTAKQVLPLPITDAIIPHLLA